MSRLLLLVLLFALIYWLIKHYVKSTSANVESVAAENMVCCARCGLYFPKSQSILADGKDFCCQDHATKDVS